MKNSYKILIVDDILENLIVVSKELEKPNTAISVAMSGKQAIKIASMEKPDLILLSISMPEMDGFETCKILKRKKETKEISIIFLTDHNKQEDIINGLNLGAVDYITLPYNKEELITRVYNHLNHKKAKDITNKQKKKLEKQNNELAELNETKDKFCSIIAHDLKSPINTILGFSEILYNNSEKLEAEESKKYTGLINHYLKHTVKLLDNLLIWSRSQRGLIKYTPKKLRLKSMVTEITMALEDMANQKGISLENNIQENIIVNADINLLSIIIRNLLTNAIKFTSRGGLIKAYAEYDKQQNKLVNVTVEDNGVGIDKESLKKLFRIEENHSTVGTNREKGTGLGLILCKEFIEKNKGTIRVESIPGIGSKFIFTLPAGKITKA